MEAGTPVFGPFVNEIPILLFEYEYRFTEYEYEKNQWYELPATIMPDGPKKRPIQPIPEPYFGMCFFAKREGCDLVKIESFVSISEVIDGVIRRQIRLFCSPDRF
jgi:hypothetical protein